MRGGGWRRRRQSVLRTCALFQKHEHRPRSRDRAVDDTSPRKLRAQKLGPQKTRGAERSLRHGRLGPAMRRTGWDHHAVDPGRLRRKPRSALCFAPLPPLQRMTLNQTLSVLGAGDRRPGAEAQRLCIAADPSISQRLTTTLDGSRPAPTGEVNRICTRHANKAIITCNYG